MTIPTNSTVTTTSTTDEPNQFSTNNNNKLFNLSANNKNQDTNHKRSSLSKCEDQNGQNHLSQSSVEYSFTDSSLLSGTINNNCNATNKQQVQNNLNQQQQQNTQDDTTKYRTETCI